MPKELEPGKVANIASYHHSPSDCIHLIVQQADWLSAGQDRQADEEQTGKRDYCTSIFASLKDKSDSANAILPLIPLALNPSIFPNSAIKTTDSAKDYQHLWQAALEHFKQLEPTEPALCIEQLIWIYSLYAWCVPSHRSQHFQISLLDHSLTTAAFASALYQYHQQTNSLNQQSILDRTVPKFRLVSGDLSGIQSYLYHTTLENPSGISKRLRSKSFYLSLLTRLAGNLILEGLGLPCVNRIIDAGGNFVLLVPNTDASTKILKETETLIQSWFYTTFQGKLNLNLDYNMQLSGNDFSATRFHVIQEQLSWNMDKSKKQPLRSILIKSGQWQQNTFIQSFVPSPIPSDQADAEGETPEDLFFNDLGAGLIANNFLLISSQPFDGQSNSTPLAHPFGRYYFKIAKSLSALNKHTLSCIEFVPGMHGKSLQTIRCGSFLANYVPRQTEQDKPFYESSNVRQWLASQLKGENEEPFSLGRQKSFAHLCADSMILDREQNLKGQPLLAVLKADVDRLGMLFSKGMKDARASLSYYISLSRQLDLFFRGILPNLFLNPPADHPDFRNIYTVYTGGDDLLLVGPWRTILTFADYMYTQFRHYVCHHPEITLSAGISVCHSRFPLSQAAEQADTALYKAKQDRNHICVFDTVLEWPDFKQALQDAPFLDAIMSNDGAEGIIVKKGFIYNLIRYCQMAQEPKKLKNLLWRSHLKYDMARNIKTTAPTGQVKPPGLQRLEQMTALTKESKEMLRLKVAVTYCLYSNRGGKL
jgi:CRISPR-associated protein Csm1